MDKIACGPSLEYAKDVLEVLKNNPVDVVVVSEVLFGGCFAAEVVGIPCVMLIPRTYNFPAEGMPPPGMMPQKGVTGYIIDKLSSAFFKKLVAYGLPAFNNARKELGLNPAKDIIDYLYNHLYRILVMTSPDFDFPAKFPANVQFTGPILDDPFTMQSWEDPWTETDDRKLVLVGFSTTYQQQENILQNIIAALGKTPYKALLTLGPAMQENFKNVPSNVIIRSFIPHSQVLPKVAVVITHAGHGTVIRSLAFGVPLICLPIGRDQPANAARVVYHGAGVRLNKKTSPDKISKAIIKVVENPDYEKKAKELSIKIQKHSEWQKAFDELELAANISHHRK